MAEVYIEGKRLDVFEGFKFSFNYSIVDIRHPEQRNAEYSKTIKCPSTPNNDSLFGQIYDVNISNPYDSTEANIEVNFNPNKKASAIIISNGLPIMKGSLQLRKIQREYTDYIYEVVFLGRLADIFGELGEKQLNGFEFDEATQTNIPYIDFSDLDHNYTQWNQQQSWTAPYGEGYVYPMLDYGKTTSYNPNGWRKYFVTDFKPALYLKEIVDRIFAFSGFSYTSTFLSSAFFKRLIVPITSNSSTETDGLFKAQVFAQQLSGHTSWNANNNVINLNQIPMAVGNDSRFSINGQNPTLICFNNDSTGGNFDNGTYTNFGNFWVNPTPYPDPAPNVFSSGWSGLASGSYTWRVNPATVGVYNLKASVVIDWFEQAHNSTAGNEDDVFWVMASKAYTLYGFSSYLDEFQGKLQLWRLRQGLTTVIQEADISIPLNNADSLLASGATGNVSASVFAENVECYNTDYFFLTLHFPQSADGSQMTGFTSQMTDWIVFNDIWFDGLPTVMRYEFRTTLSSATFENEQVAGLEALDGELFRFNENLPDVGMADVLLSVFNMFNLYVRPNPDQEMNLVIETRDDFYEGGEVKDWTHKVDYSKAISLEPLALLTANEYEYTYTEDSDYYNETYQDSHGHAYGRARIDVNNDFLNNTNTTEIIFSPTPLVNDNPSNRIIGKIYDSDIEEGAQPTDHNIRVLYYAGLLSSNPKWIHASVMDAWLYPLEYPYAGHLTHPLAPSQDINFGVPNELFYSANIYTGSPLLYTNDNLFNRYHRRGLLETTNKDSKLMTAYFNLSAVDIHKLDFRDQILIDNSFWRLNKVMDYNPFDNDLTKVELIKIITKEPLKADIFNVGSGGTIGTTDYIEKKPTVKKMLKNGNSSPLFGGLVRGENNIVEDGVTSFMVQGNGNLVKKGSQDITITGDNNIIEEGVTRVRLINTSGVTVTESNVAFVNNRQQESSEVLDGGLNTVRPINGGTNIFTVDGGLNIVQAQYSETSIYLVEGNT